MSTLNRWVVEVFPAAAPRYYELSLRSLSLYGSSGCVWGSGTLGCGTVAAAGAGAAVHLLAYVVEPALLRAPVGAHPGVTYVGCEALQLAGPAGAGATAVARD